LIRSIAPDYKVGADEESFAGNRACSKLAGAERAGVVDSRCVAEADVVVVAQNTSSISGSAMSTVVNLVAVPLPGRGMMRLVIPPL
jgi:hypothetical protein